ncbi:MAG TPA: hypothetical protein VJA26_03840 [Gammaproteobacteria bacterium]|nr:hypothetical protein [Gammaproteobacteria bacterium]
MRTAPERVAVLTTVAFFRRALAFVCPVFLTEALWTGIFFFDAFFWLVRFADFTVFFADGFPGFLRADVLPARLDADFGAVLVFLFLVAAFFVTIAWASKTN